MDVDTNYLGIAGSQLSVTGALNVNGGTLDIGRSAFSSSPPSVSPLVSANSLTNTGTISVDGDAKQGIPGVLDVASTAGFGTAGALSGTVELADAALIDFTGGGQINTIASGGDLQISGPDAFLASGSATTSNSAFQGPLTVSANATLGLHAGAAISVSSLTDGGAISVDTDFLGAAGSHLTVSGALSVSGSLTIGRSAFATGTTSPVVSVGSLTNTGGISLDGDAGQGIPGLLDVGSAAGFGSLGVLSGDVTLQDDSLLDFTGGGQINTIAYGGDLVISGAKAFLASGSATTSNSALTGLTTVDGSFSLSGGASLTTTSGDNLTVGNGTNFGYVSVDTGFGAGGSALNVQGGVILNAYGSLSVGSGSLTKATTVSVASLSILSGAVNVQGNPGAGFVGTLDVQGAAANNGTIADAGGVFEVGGALSGTGTLTLSNGAVADLYGGYSSNIAFQDAATLVLAQSGSGVISGFSVGDTIDMTSVAYNATDYVTFTPNSGGGGTVSIDNASGTTVASFNTASTYAPSQFALRNDGSGHLDIDFAQVAGDFTGNGYSDILFRYYDAANAADPLNNVTYLDFMNGATVSSGAPTSTQVGSDWQVEGIGDFNGSAATDLL
ncbi:MAG TPA: hypothetical protein VEH77_11760, partial [Roseiarcus sp.]|nr:hypothetical protein [Roseiarcus sp.]